MGQADIRKLLIVGAMSRIRWIIRRGALPDNWLGRVLERKPRIVAAVALANNEDAITRLVGALPLEQHAEWAAQRGRYTTLESVAQLSDDPVVTLPSMAA